MHTTGSQIAQGKSQESGRGPWTHGIQTISCSQGVCFRF